jgi:ABC-type sugar transport systems, permease components
MAEAAPQTAKLRAEGLNKRRKAQLTGLWYVGPWIIGFLVFQFYPFLASFYYSFTDYDLFGQANLVGFKNYIHAFAEDRDFYQSLKVTFVYALIAIPARLVFALAIALMLSVRLKGVNFFRTIYYLPSILGGSVAVSVLWRFLFMKEGVVNGALSQLHIPAVDWLGSPEVSIYTLGLLAVWQFGSSMVLFLAGIKQIPQELYEAGRVDGASRFRMFFAITIPLLTPMILFNLIMQTVNAFQEFTGAFVITNGGPLKSTYLYAMKLYEEGFLYFKMGYASALSWILFIIILILTAAIFKSSNSWVHYEDGGKSI